MPLEERVQAISFAARPAVVGRYVGELLFAIGLLMLVPVVIAGAFGDWVAAGMLATSTLGTLVIALGLRRTKASKTIQTNEAMVVAALAFVLAPIGAIAPFMVSAHAGFLDALFEAVSAVTTTGLTTLPTVEGLPESFHFTRAWMQWYGGLGIVTLSIPLLGLRGPAGSSDRAPRSRGEPGARRRQDPRAPRHRRLCRADPDRVRVALRGRRDSLRQRRARAVRRFDRWILYPTTQVSQTSAAGPYRPWQPGSGLSGAVALPVTTGCATKGFARCRRTSSCAR